MSISTERLAPLRPSRIAKRSVVVEHHKTSVSMELEFWRCLREIAKARHITLTKLVSKIDMEREHGNLSSAVRLYVLDHFRKAACPP